MLQRILPPQEILAIIDIHTKMGHLATDVRTEVERLIEKQPKDLVACCTSTPVLAGRKVIRKPRRARSISLSPARARAQTWWKKIRMASQGPKGKAKSSSSVDQREHQQSRSLRSPTRASSRCRVVEQLSESLASVTLSRKP